MGVQDLSEAASLLQRYYAHDLAKVEPAAWVALLEMADSLASEHPFCAEAIEQIVNAPANDKDQFEYEFNRLFVGPGRPECPPYETIYVSQDDTLMRDTTERIRKAYRDADLEPDLKNIEPDDHFAFEMAFVAKLLDGMPQSSEKLKSFSQQHMGKWVSAHVASVRTSTENVICLGFAQLLECLTSEITRSVSEEKPQKFEEEGI